MPNERDVRVRTIPFCERKNETIKVLKILKSKCEIKINLEELKEKVGFIPIYSDFIRQYLLLGSLKARHFDVGILPTFPSCDTESLTISLKWRRL